MTTRTPLEAQIGEVQFELSMRRSVYANQVSRGKMRQAEADLHTEQLQAVLATLTWLLEHKAAFLAFVDVIEGKATP